MGCKCDLNDKRVVTYEEGKEYADSLGIDFYEISSKDGTNVDEVFSTLASKIMDYKITCPKENSSIKRKNILIGVTGSVAAVKVWKYNINI